MELANERHGTGHPLVLVHGITECGASWGRVAEALAQHYDVLNVDLRGHGQSPKGDTYDALSMAADVVATWTAAGMDAPLLVGHSLGGVVVTAASVIGAPCAVVDVDQPLRLAAFKDGLGQLEPMLRGSPEQFAAAIEMVFAALHGQLSADEVSRIGALRAPNQEVVMGVWASVLESTSEELDATVAALLGEVTVQFLSLHGIDPGSDYASWLTGLMPTATVEVWADHGHYPHLVDSARFVQRVLDFDPRR